jgi:hypothetical protein
LGVATLRRTRSAAGHVQPPFACAICIVTAISDSVRFRPRSA